MVMVAHRFENGCVIVINGKITDVGARENIKIPANANVVDGTGMSLLPGFIDAHFHMTERMTFPECFCKME
jgi:imidazolonepropionase-like amidohydrolase